MLSDNIVSFFFGPHTLDIDDEIAFKSILLESSVSKKMWSQSLAGRECFHEELKNPSPIVHHLTGPIYDF